MEHLKKNGNKLNMERELLLKPHIHGKKQAQEEEEKKNKKKLDGMVEMWNMMPNITKTIHQHGKYPGHNVK